MQLRLDESKDILEIQQKTIYHNFSKDTLKELFFHNWNNSFKTRKSPLTKRLIDDYDKSLYFAGVGKFK